MRRYIDIANIIRQRILNNIYIAGGKIPYGHQLCDEFSCTKITLKKALEILVQEGYITRQRGLGTIVKTSNVPSSGKVSQKNLPILGLSTIHAANGNRVSSQLLSFNLVNPDEEIAAALGMQVEQFAYHFKRVRYVNEQAVSIEDTWIPVKILPAFTQQDAQGSVYQYVERTLSRMPCSAHTHFFSRPSNEEDQQFLWLAPNEPVTVTVSVTYLNDGQAFEYSTSHHHYLFFNYNAVTQRV